MAEPEESARPRVDWVVVLPVKRLGLAKTRLTRFAGDQRQELALAFVSDVEGTGTTMLAARTLEEFQPRFGHRSRAAHRLAGVTELEGAGLTSLRRDVDTEVDVHDARRLGLGPRSAEVVARLLG
jgi:2-phospho-L-lactate guanylyltransferase (CobY/MobA/RfbA family)